MNREEQERKVKDDVVDDIEIQNMSADMPAGAYHRVMISGAGFNVDVYTPAVNGNIDFLELKDIAAYLALFCKDDSIQDVVRKQILSLNHEGLKK